MARAVPGPMRSLNKHIEANRKKYDACIDSIPHDLDTGKLNTTLRLHFVRFDANGEPKFNELAKCLADHIVSYCLSSRSRNAPETHDEWARLSREARKLFRKYPTGGEAGEILLYFLLEAVIGAPQVVAKMDLKTNPNLESNGSDGIHMKWNSADQCLDIFFGESKLETSLTSAIKNALSSVHKFHTNNIVDHEFRLVTSHFKWIEDKALQKHISAFVDRQQPTCNCRINHACLIGFDWSEYKKLKPNRRIDIAIEFASRYRAQTDDIHDAVVKSFKGLRVRNIIYEMFFIPFRSVQEFRDAFIEALS